MSRAGRRSRQRRLIESGVWRPAGQWSQPQAWTPTRCLRPEASTEEEQLRLARLLLERDTWIRTSGREGWQREQTRQRAERNARLRERRLSGYAEARRAA
jgi:hypothetical protein